MEDLRQYLRNLPPGPLTEDQVTEVEPLLADCWHGLSGSRKGGMSAQKLIGRMEDVKWDPPELTFSIERHGGTFLGSTRAEIQDWEINVDEERCLLRLGRHRQKRPMSPPVDVKPIAEELARKMLAGEADERLRWRDDGTVGLLTGVAFSEGPKQTLAGRRKRLRKALEERLAEEGWTMERANLYAPPEH